MTNAIGLAPMRGQLLSFADIDHDGYVDLIVGQSLGEATAKVEDWLWNDAAVDEQTGASGRFRVNPLSRAEVHGLEGVITADLNSKCQSIHPPLHDECANARFARGVHVEAQSRSVCTW